MVLAANARIIPQNRQKTTNENSSAETERNEMKQNQ